jgi:hypothetical protein
VYGLLFLTGVILSMSPKVIHYFSPLQEQSSKLNYNNKNSWPFFYWIKFVSYIFLDIAVKDISNDPNFLFSMKELELSNVMILYKIFSPIFLISLILELFIKLYQLRVLFLTENFHKPINGKISAKITKKNFSTLSFGSKMMTAKVSYLSLTTGVLIVSALNIGKIFYIDIPNHMYPWRYIKLYKGTTILSLVGLWLYL